MRIALLISGRGSTANSIINAINTGQLPGVIPACVVSSRTNAAGIERVQAAGIPKDKVYVVSPSPFPKGRGPLAVRDFSFGEALLKIFKDNAVDFIGQYGWLAMTPSNVIEKYKNMMTNQHDGPLDPGRPDFGGEGMYGLRVCCARLLFVRKTNHDFWTEATSQRVALKFDEGAVVKTARVPILQNDTPEALSARLLPVEHQLQIDTLRDFASGTVKEIHRDQPLIASKEIGVLNWAKKEAVLKYPKG